VAAPLPIASLGRRIECGRTEQRQPPGSKRYETKDIIVWRSFLIAAVALRTPPGLKVRVDPQAPAHAQRPRDPRRQQDEAPSVKQR